MRYSGHCLHQLFEAQVQRSPDAIALTFERQQLTYADLNHRANQLAHYLQSLGLQPDQLVGICGDRGLELVIGLLGILKAGGAYVPLDPDFPPARLQWMLADAQPPILLTQETWRQRLPEHQAHVVCWDSDASAIALQPSHNPDSTVSSEHLAYVIYTSGSTGKPKGVPIPHCSVVNFLTSMQRRPGLSATDTLLAVTSISFDIAALELFLPLITGARLALVSRRTATDGALLSQQLKATGTTVMQATPATWRMLLAAGWRGDGDLTILCGGEALSGDLARRLLASGAAVWNLYGPTETTIWSTIYPLESQLAAFASTIPIGRPIANTHIHLLDRQGQAVPIGVPGELHIGGEGLARGYLNRPELTAERFIIHPQWGRLYRTGDLARYQADGVIEYLGRLDYQVKIRGFRIELGEVESALSQHPAIQAAVVVSQSDPSGEARLVAYVVFDGGFDSEPPVTASELRRFLQERLPDYMTPTRYVPLEALPLTPNGKVDRKALPAPDLSRNEDDLVLPRNASETTLAILYRTHLRSLIEMQGFQESRFCQPCNH